MIWNDIVQCWNWITYIISFVIKNVIYQICIFKVCEIYFVYFQKHFTVYIEKYEERSLMFFFTFSCVGSFVQFFVAINTNHSGIMHPRTSSIIQWTKNSMEDVNSTSALISSLVSIKHKLKEDIVIYNSFSKIGTVVYIYKQLGMHTFFNFMLCFRHKQSACKFYVPNKQRRRN